MKDLAGKVVLVTGGAHGIGLETARAFARAGARVVVADVNQQWLDEAVKDLRAGGHEAKGIRVDLREREQVYEMIDRATWEMGQIDILVNNAGVVFPRRIMDIDEEEINDTLKVNIHAPIWATKKVLPQMMERRLGHIVNIGSAAGKTTNPYISVYCATKFAVVGFTDSLHQELHGSGIETTLVNPGWIKSGMFKGAKRVKLLTRWVPPELVARKIIDAVVKSKAEIHVPRMMWIGGFLRAILGPKVMDFLWRLFRGQDLFAGVVGHE